MAAYVVVVDAIEDAVSRDASRAVVSVHAGEQQLVVTVDDDGDPRQAPLTGIADRVGALAGRLQLETTSVHAEIPCA